MQHLKSSDSLPQSRHPETPIILKSRQLTVVGTRARPDQIRSSRTPARPCRHREFTSSSKRPWRLAHDRSRMKNRARQNNWKRLQPTGCAIPWVTFGPTGEGTCACSGRSWGTRIRRQRRSTRAPMKSVGVRSSTKFLGDAFELTMPSERCVRTFAREQFSRVNNGQSCCVQSSVNQAPPHAPRGHPFAVNVHCIQQVT